MGRKVKKMKTIRGEYVREMDRRILELHINIQEIQRTKRKLMESCQEQRTMKGVDFESEKISGGNRQLSFHETITRIDGLQKNIDRLTDEKKELEEKRKNFIKKFQIDAQYSSHAGVFYWREIMGLSQQATADKIGYSLRQVQRIEKELRRKDTNDIVSDSDTIQSIGIKK